MQSTRMLVITFDDIKAMLKAHVDVLLHHSSYIRDIENNKISEDNLMNYLTELFEFSVPDTKIFRATGVAGLKRSVDIKLKIFLNFLKIARHPNTDIAMSALYLAMESEIYYSGYDVKVSRGKNRDFNEKFQTALNAHGFLKKLNASLYRLLPPDFPILINYVSHIIRCDKETDWSECAQYIYGWLNVKSTLEVGTSKLLNLDTGKWKSGNPFRVKPNETIEHLSGWQTLLDEAFVAQGVRRYTDDEVSLEVKQLNELIKKLEARIVLNDEKHREVVEAANMVTWVYDLVLHNVEFYFQIRNDLNVSLLFLRSMIMLPTLLRELEKSVSATMRLTRIECKRMSKCIVTIDDQLRSIHDLSACHEVENELDKCRSIMEQLANNDELELNIDAVKALAKEFDRQLIVVNKLLVAVKKVQSSQVQVVALTVNNQKDEKRELALLEGERKRQAYRDQVRLERLARGAQKQKQEVPIVLPSAPLTFFENESVKDRLLKMPQKYFNLLLSLLRNERGIKYYQVCNLILNHLDGSITEHGSSHKSFRIAKWYVEVTCNTMQATGGICGPHGGAHQSGEMSSFNVELVAKGLIAAGYTEKVLLEIEGERAANKLSL